VEYFQCLYDSFNSSNHTLNHTISRLEEVKGKLEISQQKYNNLAHELKTAQKRYSLSEEERENEAKRVEALQEALADMAKQFEAVMNEKELLEQKILRIGEGFMKILL
jgi:chromosome segregation ATPase